MKVKCLNTSKYNRYDRLPLTVGKVYDVIDITRIPFNESDIVLDIEYYRNEKLNKILE